MKSDIKAQNSISRTILLIKVINLDIILQKNVPQSYENPTKSQNT